MPSGLQLLERERKFYVTVMVILLATLLRAFDAVSDAVYGEIIIYATGLFMLGNVGEHGAKAWKERVSKPPEPAK